MTRIAIYFLLLFSLFSKNILGVKEFLATSLNKHPLTKELSLYSQLYNAKKEHYTSQYGLKVDLKFRWDRSKLSNYFTREESLGSTNLHQLSYGLDAKYNIYGGSSKKNHYETVNYTKIEQESLNQYAINKLIFELLEFYVIALENQKEQQLLSEYIKALNLLEKQSKKAPVLIEYKKLELNNRLEEIKQNLKFINRQIKRWTGLSNKKYTLEEFDFSRYIPNSYLSTRQLLLLSNPIILANEKRLLLEKKRYYNYRQGSNSTVDLNFSYGGGDNIYGPTEQEEYLTYGLEFNYNIYDSGKKIVELKKRKLEIQILEEKHKALIDDISKNFNLLWHNYKKPLNSLKIKKPVLTTKKQWKEQFDEVNLYYQLKKKLYTQKIQKRLLAYKIIKQLGFLKKLLDIQAK